MGLRYGSVLRLYDFTLSLWTSFPWLRVPFVRSGMGQIPRLCRPSAASDTAGAGVRKLRRLFPSQVKIGAVEHIRELVNVALPGIAVRPLPVAPRQLPFYAGATYFELDRASPHWQQMQNSGGFAIHVSGDFPNLRLELWAIRG